MISGKININIISPSTAN